MAQLRGSVGNGGKNLRDDVLVVQRLINAKLPIPLMPLAEDGFCGSKTIFAIQEYQRRNLRMNPPDGRVDPGGATFRSLTDGAVGPIGPPRPINPPTPVPTPPSGPIAPNVARPTIMRESAWRYLLQFTVKHESLVPHMYNNRKAGSKVQDVTCGIGFQIAQGAETKPDLMALFFDPATLQTPTRNQMETDWIAAATHDRTNTNLAQYGQICSMRMYLDRTYDHMAVVLRDQKLPALLRCMNSTTGQKDYKDFASFPAAAQVFCLSFAYGRIPFDFPKMGTYIRLGQWKAAATECHQIGCSETKQTGHRQLLQFAQNVVDQGRNFDEVPAGIL